ncbi:MAG: hypothetical protein J6B34_06055, partial [Clostridia bacterium]|nr:hypothetical protein [Clostridia bacterium]
MAKFGHFFGIRTREEPSNVSRKWLENASDDELLSQFKDENWTKINKNGRLEILQELEVRNSVYEDRDPAIVTFGDDMKQGHNGGYSHDRNAIRLNHNYLGKDQFKLLATYFHESRHAQQTNSPEELVGHRTKLMCELERMPRNDNSGKMNYIGADENYKLYRTQVSEMDSNNYAAAKMLSLSENFKGEEKYYSHLADAEGKLKEANEAVERVQYERAQVLNSNLDQGLAAEKISEAERIEQNKINCVISKDELVVQSRELEKQLHQKLEKYKKQAQSSDANGQGAETQSGEAKSQDEAKDNRLIHRMIKKNNSEGDEEGEGEGEEGEEGESNVSGISLSPNGPEKERTPEQEPMLKVKQTEQNNIPLFSPNQNINFYPRKPEEKEKDKEEEEEYGMSLSMDEDLMEGIENEETKENITKEPTEEEAEAEEVTEENLEDEEPTEEEAEAEETTAEEFEGEESTEEEAEAEETTAEEFE